MTVTTEPSTAPADLQEPVAPQQHAPGSAVPPGESSESSAAPEGEQGEAAQESAGQPRKRRSRGGRRAKGPAREGDASGPAAERGQPQQPRQPSQSQSQQSRQISPLLDQLAGFYPHLFGEVFLPLKRGIFEDLLTAHPDVFEREALKEALSQHTRSSRYLTSVAAGRPRHDLQGQVNEAMAPEHVHHALLEVFRRRARRAGEDVRPQLRKRIAQAFEASGLSPAEYAQLVRGRDEEANQLLDDALAEVTASSAKGEALLRAFDASGQTVEAFAEMYGLDPRDAGTTLERARRGQAAKSAA